MKKYLLLFSGSIYYSVVITQVPESFNYQAIQRNRGALYPEQAMIVRIIILPGNSTGSSVYIETFNATTTSLGLLNLQIGKGNMVSGNLSTLNWGFGIILS